MSARKEAAKFGITEAQYKRAEALAKARIPMSEFAGGNSMFTYDYQTRMQMAIGEEIAKLPASSGTSSGDSQGSASGSSASSYSGIQEKEVRDMLKGMLIDFNAGGTEEYKKAQAARDATISGVDEALSNYTKEAAFTDAGALMAKSVKDSMEANKPAIQRAIEGSGTSAGSMQALLSQQLADKTALSAGALGAEQAKAYGQVATNLLNTRGQLTPGTDMRVDPMAKLADLLRVQTQQSTSYGNFDPANMYNAETARSRLIAEQNSSLGGGSSGGSTGGSSSIPQLAFPELPAGIFNTGKGSGIPPVTDEDYNPTEEYYRQYAYEGNDTPVANSIYDNPYGNSKTYTYGTDPSKPGYMQITRNS